MRLLNLLMLCGVLLFAGPMVARGAGAAADPLSGKWADANGAGFDLKFDGKRVVTGTIQTPRGPAAIKTGTFEPKTGALQLEGEAKLSSGKMGPYVIRGKVGKDTITGSYAFGTTDKGQFTFTRQ